MNPSLGCLLGLGLSLVFSPAILLATEEEAKPLFLSRGITRHNVTGWVDVEGTWVNGASALKVRFSPTEDFEGKIPVQAGFFDANKNLLHRFDKVPHMQTKGHGTAYQAPPSKLEKGKIYDLYFPVPPSISSGGSRWTDFLVVLGKGNQATAISHPKSGLDPAEFSFAAEPSSAAAENVNAKLVIRNARSTPLRTNIWADGGWKSGLNVVQVTLMVEEGAEAGDFYVRAYYYDRDGNLIETFKEPARTEVSRGREYTSLPPVWKNKAVETVYFPISPRLETGASRVQDIVVVFGNTSTAVATMSSNSRGKLEDFDFPEKQLVLASASE
jgi:hypothetical protein